MKDIVAKNNAMADESGGPLSLEVFGCLECFIVHKLYQKTKGHMFDTQKIRVTGVSRTLPEGPASLLRFEASSPSECST